MQQKAERPGGGQGFLSRTFLLAALLAPYGTVSGQTAKPESPWDLGALAQAPSWEALERPRADAVKPIFFKGPPWRGKATRAFAWLGLPEVKPGEKVPGMVLVHGGGGT